MPKIEVRFEAVKKVSKAGREYQLIEMWITDRDGSWPERATISIMPFHARLLLQSLPELCEAIKKAEGMKDSQGELDFNAPQESSGPASPF